MAKQSPKQRAASLRNLRKARRARKVAGEPKKVRRRKARSHTKSVRHAARRSTSAPRKPRRRKARAAAAEPTKAKRRSAGRKAAATRKRNKARRRSRASDWKGEPRRHAKAARKGWRKRRSTKHPHHKAKVRSRKRAKKVRTKTGKYRTRKQIAAARRNIKKAHSARKGRKSSVAGHYKSSVSTSQYPVAAERRRGRRRAKRNPFDTKEVFLGLFSGLSGFLVADLFDRLASTHALTGAGPYTDTPPTTGRYQGLYNATAICAPMDPVRWLVGIGSIAAPAAGAYFIKGALARSFFQGATMGAAFRVFGKAAIDTIAMLTTQTQMGQQLYDGEMRAAALAAGNGSATSPGLQALPSAGLGKAGVGDCAPCAAKATNPGAGYPSAPRQAAPATATATPAPAPSPPPQMQLQPPPALPPAPANTAPPAFSSTVLTGVPRGANPGRRRFNWGDES